MWHVSISRGAVEDQRLKALRVQGGGASSWPTVGLFEADGGAWRLVAVDRVRDWLTENLPNTVAVLA